ncbi:MAG: TRAP transporter substrate-binding protein [Neomegalonema sp.]|nr:TRAP transporter substrate-binding protein [Neomegalonema sp.]
MASSRRTFLKTSAAAAATVAAPFVLSPSRARAADVTLRLHQFLPAQANVPKLVLDPWADRVEKASGGRIKIERYPSMQLGGKPPELVDQVVDGVVDIIWTVAGYTPGRFPRAEVFELPFTMTNATAVSKAFWELGEQTMFNEDFKQVKPLGLWVHGPGLIHSKNPVTSIADLEGLRVRAPTRTSNLLLKSLKATPIGMPVPAIPEALSKGVIEACVIPWEVTAALKVPELVENHTEFGKDALYTTAFLFAMNKDKYASLPDDLKEVIDSNSGLEFSGKAGGTQAASDGPARQAAVDRGNNIITLSPDQVAEWKEASKPLIESWKADLDGKGLNGSALFDKAQELIAKHTG